jgi:hypothetical protein
MFSPYAAEKIGWYVYALRNPLDGRVFYIGKGTGNRVLQHAKDAKAATNESVVSQKLDVIKSIHAAGKEVDAFLLRYQLKSEKEAYEVESAVIDTLRLLDDTGNNDLFAVTNIVLGHHHLERGLAPVHVAASRFDAEPMPAVEASIVIFGIPELWTPSMGDAEIYDAVRGFWTLRDRAFGATYAAAAHKNVIRGIYKITYWRERVEGDRDWEQDLAASRPRRGFVGASAPEMEHLLHKSIKHIPVGGSVRYVNCGADAPIAAPFYDGDSALRMAERDGYVP